MATADASLALYQYLCQNIVGTEEIVKEKRLVNNIRDIALSNSYSTHITSGSFGEGLEMKGSDLDFMFVDKNVIVHETLDDLMPDSSKTIFLMDLEDSKPGFTKLCLISPSSKFNSLCIEIGGSHYLSNKQFKSALADNNPITDTEHGPCISDENNGLDLAFCLHSRSWISSANEWIHRSGYFPNNYVKSKIIDHGVLFVPIGVKDSEHEELGWRISFSVSEKLLIYSFSHTQLLCYILMKILLKDVIEMNVNCRNLLCSFFLKMIMFWVCEEVPEKEWTPENLIPCFMRCFGKLMYCVEYSVCPHYFIPENNLFENRFDDTEHLSLLENLKTLYGSGWQCILMSQQLSNFQEFSYKTGRNKIELSQEEIKHMLCSKVLALPCCGTDYKRMIKLMGTYSSASVRQLISYFISFSSKTEAGKSNLAFKYKNKHMYRQFKICLSYLLQHVQNCPVSSWFILASFFYTMREYKIALHILAYALTQCTPDKIFSGYNISRNQTEFVMSPIWLNVGLIHTYKYLTIDTVVFRKNYSFIPEELYMEVGDEAFTLPPVAFAHFVSFLCHYQLNNVRQCRFSLRDLELTLTDDYFVKDIVMKSLGYDLLGTALLLAGDQNAARDAFMKAVELQPRLKHSRHSPRI